MTQNRFKYSSPDVAGRLAERSTINAETGCVEWAGKLDAWGYGRLKVPGWAGATVHRHSYRVHFGPIPDGMLVCHKCDNPKCWNPDHLFLGTSADNMKDMAAKGRASRRTGLDNPNSPTKIEDAKRVLALAAKGNRQADIARLTGIKPTIVSDIVRGTHWTNRLIGRDE